MATAKINKQIITKTKVVEYQEELDTGITLNLTPDEASVLFFLVSKTAVCNEAGHNTYAIFKALDDLRIKKYDGKIQPHPLNGSLIEIVKK